MTLETELTVDLNHEDIADIAETMNNQLSNKDKLSQGYMEWLLCYAIRTVRNVDFFEEQRKISVAEERNRDLSMGKYDET